MSQVIWVALGGALGALARFGSSKALNLLLGNHFFPAATLLINCAGSFLFGFFLHKIQSSPGFALFFAVGVLGAFTTFSTFSFETVQLFRDGKVSLFVLNIIASVALGLFSFVLGLWIQERL